MRLTRNAVKTGNTRSIASKPPVVAWLLTMMLAACVAMEAKPTRASASCAVEPCEAKSERIAHIRTLQPAGARPRWHPSGDLIVFDRKNADGFYDVYLSDRAGRVVGSLTADRQGIAQRNNGNAVFHPSGEYIVFVSETPKHYGTAMKWLGDPGVGLFSNLWATTVSGGRFWQLTDIPIKQTLLDPTPAMGVVNPLFAPGGSPLLWTERYGPGGNHNWGMWRIKKARFVTGLNGVALQWPRVLYTPPRYANYVTATDFLGAYRMLVAGNLDGQHEYGMDQYVLDLRTRALINLQRTPRLWEEDTCVSPSGQTIVYMSNATSRYPLDFNNPNWPAQPREREYWVMDADGRHKERLTFFNDPAAPEYTGRRTIVAACDISPDGRYLAGTLGLDHGTETEAKIALGIILIQFREPLP